MSKSIKIAPGIRMNVSKSGIGYSVGGKGYRVTKHANGRVSRTASVPGLGLSHTKTLSPARRRTGSGSGSGSTGARAGMAPPAVPRPPKPGFLAPAWEKALFEAADSGRPDSFVAVARAHGRTEPFARLAAAALEGLWHFQRCADGTGDTERARALLGWVVAQDVGSLRSHPYVVKYLAERTWPVEIASGIVAELRLSNDAVLLAAGELHQTAGDLDAAIWTVEQAEPTAPAALSLVELYSDAGRHQEVIDLTTGIDNADDATALLLVLRGRAFAQIGYNDAAREALRQALQVRTRAPEVRHRALLERAQVSLAQNRKAAARKDVEKVFAEDPSYPGLADALAALL